MCVCVCVCVCVRGVLVGMNHRRYGAGPVPRHCCVRAYECIFSQRNLCHFPNHPSCYLQSPCSQDSSLFVSCPLLTDSFPNVTLFSLTRNVSIHCVPFTGNVLCIFPSLLHLGHPSLYWNRLHLFIFPQWFSCVSAREHTVLRCNYRARNVQKCFAQLGRAQLSERTRPPCRLHSFIKKAVSTYSAVVYATLCRPFNPRKCQVLHNQSSSLRHLNALRAIKWGDCLCKMGSQNDCWKKFIDFVYRAFSIFVSSREATVRRRTPGHSLGNKEFNQLPSLPPYCPYWRVKTRQTFH